jgi:hypothetical protein
MKGEKIVPSEELAYWVGVVRTDGCLKFHTNKNGNVDSRISLHVAEKSLPMSVKFQRISSEILNRKSKIWKGCGHLFYFHIGVAKILNQMKGMDIIFGDPPIPPDWCLKSPNTFGAYMAGVIDGDGMVKIIGHRYPQCKIKISSGIEQVELASRIREIYGCWVGIYKRHHFSKIDERIVEGNWFELEFYVSRKNISSFSNFVLPHLEIKHKRDKLENYIRTRYN